MMKIPMNNLITKTIALDETFDLKAAVESIRLWQLEIEYAEKARKKAEEYLDKLLAESLKNYPLKFLEGELIALPKYHKMFCYMHEDFISIPVPEEYINEGIL